MRIGIDIGCLVHRPMTGVQQLVRECVRELCVEAQVKGHELVLVGVIKRGDEKYLRSVLKEIKTYETKVRLIGLPLRFWELVWKNINCGAGKNFGCCLITIIFKWWFGEFAIVHSFDGPIWPYSGKLSMGVCDITPRKFPEFHSLSNRLAFEKRMEYVKSAEIITALSHQTEGDLITDFGVDRELIKTIYPGIRKFDVAPPLSHGTQKSLKERLKIGGRKLMVVMGGNNRKNASGVINAWQGIDEKIKQETLVVVVGETQKETEGVMGLGFVKDAELAELFSLAWVVVVGTWYEGFGLPIAEAMKAGALVVCNEIGSMREVGGEAAIYISNDKREEWIEVCRKALMKALEMSTEERLLKIGFGQKWISNFSYKKMSLEMINEWERMMGKHK